jgi:hypothetical protein
MDPSRERERERERERAENTEGTPLKQKAPKTYRRPK